MSHGELALMVGSAGSNPKAQDGDILCAMNNKRILYTHAQHRSKPTTFTSDGLRPAGTSSEFLKRVRKYHFIRVSKTEVRRVDMWNGNAEEIFSKTTEKYMDVDLFVRRRLKHEKHLIYGTLSLEEWYGGGTKVTDIIISDVWDVIENDQSGILRTNFEKWPFSDIELTNYLIFPTDNFDDDKWNSLVAEVTIPDPQDAERTITTAKRDFFVDIPTLGLPSSETDIRNRNLLVDVRDSMDPITLSTISKSKIALDLI